MNKEKENENVITKQVIPSCKRLGIITMILLSIFVVSAAATLNPSEGSAGTHVIATGSVNPGKDTIISAYWDNPNPATATKLGETHAAIADGKWVLNFDIPPGAGIGDHNVWFATSFVGGGMGYTWFESFKVTPPTVTPTPIPTPIPTSEQPQLKAPWEGVAKIIQGNHGSYSHNVCYKRTAPPDPNNCAWENTYAVDIDLNENDVLTPANGTVEYIDDDPNGSGGKELAIAHIGPSGKKFYTIYLHLGEILVKKGWNVTQGEIVSISDNTGSGTTGPHLHFHMGTSPVDYATIPIERLMMKNISDCPSCIFKEYNAIKGELDDNKIGGYKSFESNNIPIRRYAAFAYSPTNQITSIGSGISQAGAQDYAEARCRLQGGKDCQAVGWWQNGFGSFATGPNDQWGWGTSTTIDNADRLALSSCGNGCQLKIRSYLDGSLPFAWALRISKNTASQGHPAIYGNRVVWTDNRKGNNDIYMYDFSTNKERQITTNTASQGNPAIYGNRVVYEDFRNNNYDIYMYDLSTNKERQITTNTARQLGPAIYGNRIVYEDFRNDNDDIYMYDLSTNKERQITTNITGQYEPTIYGNRIVYEDERNGGGDIYMYDLSTNKESQIIENIASRDGGSYTPVIYENRIVYEYERNGSTDVYLNTIS